MFLLAAAAMPAAGGAAMPGPVLENTYLLVNGWEPLKRDGQEQFRLVEADASLHLPVLPWRAPDGGADTGWAFPAWFTLHAAARMMDIPGTPIVTPTLNPSLNAGWFHAGPADRWLAGVQGRLAHVTNAQTGPTLTPATDPPRPGVGRYNERDGRFTTDNWRVTAVGRFRCGDGTGGAPRFLTVSQSYQREIAGADGAAFGPLGPALQGWYPAARETTEIGWNGGLGACGAALRGVLEATFEGRYATFRRHYANALVEGSLFPPLGGRGGGRLGAFARFQWGFDPSTILFTTKIHELVAGLVWTPAAGSGGS